MENKGTDAQATQALALSLLLTASVPLLPPGWQIARDPATGKFYFYNITTGVVQWEPPGITDTAKMPTPQGGGEGEPPVKKRHRLDCPAHVRASSFLGSLGFSPAFLDATQNSCFCEQCANGLPASKLQCSQIYELPHGFVGFGIQMGPCAASLRIFKEWPVSYHGLKAANLGSVLNEGGLMLSGDTLLDGTTLKALHTMGANRQCLYTSPSIKYAEKVVYTEPMIFEEHRARIVVQCRQKPDFEVCGETIGWERDHPGVAISKHFKNSELEWFTRNRAAIIPYRILIKMETPKYSVRWPFGTYAMSKGDIVKCDAQEIWRIGDVVKAVLPISTTLDGVQGKVEANAIGIIKKLMAADKDVLHVDFEDSVGLIEVHPSHIRKCAPAEFLAVGDWVKATGGIDYKEFGIVTKGLFGIVISPKSTFHWKQSVRPPTASPSRYTRTSCAGGCGFFGSAPLDFYCSTCFKNAHGAEEFEARTNANLKPPPGDQIDGSAVPHEDLTYIMTEEHAAAFKTVPNEPESYSAALLCHSVRV
jgi:hypothetical protein